MWGVSTRRFLERVVPWPVDPQEDPGYVNIHYMQASQRGTFMYGRPYKTVQSACAGMARLLQDDKVKDIYFCLSLQRKAKQMKNGWFAAERSSEGAMQVKALWIDIDVKPNDPAKGYPDFNSAMTAFMKFTEKWDLPKPSMIVKSGGGVHVYWTFTAPVDVPVWQDLAERLKGLLLKDGLKCDAHITADAARVLRPPETWNWKNGEKRPVDLFYNNGPDYDVSVLQEIFKDHEPVKVARTQPALQSNALAGLTPNPDAVAIGMEIGDEDAERDPLVLNQHAIFTNCPFMRNTLVTGGKDNSEPLWDLSVLATAFLPDGEKIAHLVSKGHDGYVPAHTAEKYARKIDFKGKGGGWPTCGAIKSAGCNECATCPHFGVIKSPLTLGISRSEPVGVGGSIPDARTQETKDQEEELYLPPGYFLDADGYICQKAKDDEGGHRLFLCKLSDPAIQLPYSMSFTCTVGMNPPNHVSLPKKDIGGQGMLTTLQEQGLSPNLHNPNPTKNIGAFLMAWISMLENHKKLSRTKMLGWVDGMQNKKHIGFAYGGRLWHTNGDTDTPVGYNDPVIKSQYQPQGSVEPWKTAARLTIEHRRPDLSVILAGAFAAPLAAFAGQTGSMICACGATGIGKSTASLTGAAVWGHPRATRFAVNSTANSFSNTLGKIVSLPLYWDEVKDDEDYRQLTMATFSGSQGVEKHRMDRHGNIKESGTWKTVLIATCNRSFYDHLIRANKDKAALFRVFEYTIPEEITENRLDHYHADHIVGELDSNYGVVGLEYVKYLVANQDKVAERVLEVGREFNQLANIKQHERFWSNVASTVLVGAEIAKKMGFADFDLDGMRKFLVASVSAMRKRVTNETVDNESTTTEVLTTFLKSHSRGTIVTEGGRENATGRPKRVSVLHGLDRYAADGVQIQFLKEANMVRISIPALEKWMADNDMANAHIYRMFDKFFKVKKDRATLGAGTEWAKGQERVLEITFEPGNDLYRTMIAMGPDADGEVAHHV